MGTKTEDQQLRAEKRRQRQRVRAERRRGEHMLVPVAAAQRLGIPTATRADAMRQVGITTAITEKQAQRWTADPESAPKWLMQLRGERLRTPPEPGADVVVRDHGGHLRRAQVVEVDGPLFEATFSLKSGQWRRRWFDLAAIEPSEVNSL